MAAPLRVFIVDDESPARARLRGLLGDCAASLANQVVGEADSGSSALVALESVRADVMLLDIRMPGMDGIELARRLNALPDPPAIIFVTAYDTHAVTAFELQACDYLVKPVRLERLREALARVKRSDPEGIIEAHGSAYLTVSDRGRVMRVPLSDILFLRAELKYVTLRTEEREYVLDDALTKLEESYPDDFVRIHRNCLVNKARLEGFEMVREGEESRWVAVLRGWPERLPVSRRQAHVVKAFRQN